MKKWIARIMRDHHRKCALMLTDRAEALAAAQRRTIEDARRHEHQAKAWHIRYQRLGGT